MTWVSFVAMGKTRRADARAPERSSTRFSERGDE
jgi:hypothetical protein